MKKVSLLNDFMNNIELLDYFAGHVLQAMIWSKTEKGIMEDMKKQYYPNMAYFIANEMLKERKKYFPTKTEVTTIKQIQ
jgi:hypothetical protein